VIQLGTFLAVLLCFGVAAEAAILGVEPGIDRFGRNAEVLTHHAQFIFVLNLILYALLIAATSEEDLPHPVANFTMIVLGVCGLVAFAAIDLMSATWEQLLPISYGLRFLAIAFLLRYALAGFFDDGSMVRMHFENLRSRFRGP
jgi:hypothetical protein